MKRELGEGTIDLIRAVCVLAVLVGLTLFVANHYGQDATKAAAVLAAVTPVLGAIVGVSIAYPAGKAKGQQGKADAVSRGRQTLADHMLGLLDQPVGGAESVPAVEDPRLTRIRDSLQVVKQMDAPSGE